MFNRAIQVKVVKSKKEDPQKVQPAEVKLEDVMTVVNHQVEQIIQHVGKAVIAYVVVDTVRKILIAKATKS